MDIYISLTIITGLISWYIKVTTRDKLLSDLYKKRVEFKNFDYDKIDAILAQELLQFKKFHYFIPGSNLVVVLLYRISYYLKKDELLLALIKQDIIKENLNLKNSKPIQEKIIAIKKEQDKLMQVKEKINNQKEKSLKRH